MTTTAVNPSALTQEQKQLLTSPYGFGRHILGLPLMDQPRRKIGECREGDAHFYDVWQNDAQKRVVDDLDSHGAKVAARTANGAGKTTMLVPTAALWFMAIHPRSKVVITSGVDRQVREQLFPALHAQKKTLKDWRFNDADIDAPNGARCVGFTTRDGGHFEGWHGNKVELYDLLQHDGPLMIIVDEAKSVQPQIFDAIDRCTYQRLLMVSSCGAATGRFHDAFTKDARFWKTHQIGADLCPHADHEKNKELILRRGLNDALVRSKIFAEFSGSEEGALIQLDWLNRCTERRVQFRDGPANYYCDFARGGDENVLAEARGNRVRVVAAWREKDTMRACGEFIRLFRQAGLAQDAVQHVVAGDNCGLGAVIIDRLHELGWGIQRDEANGKADDAERYVNRSAETWGDGAKALEEGRWILGDDEQLTAQLISRKTKPRSDGRIQLESKEDMAKRGIGSPDRADAVLGAMRKPKSYAPQAFMHGGTGRDFSLIEQLAEAAGHHHQLTGTACE